MLQVSRTASLKRLISAYPYSQVRVYELFEQPQRRDVEAISFGSVWRQLYWCLYKWHKRCCQRVYKQLKTGERRVPLCVDSHSSICLLLYPAQNLSFSSTIRLRPKEGSQPRHLVRKTSKALETFVSVEKFQQMCKSSETIAKYAAITCIFFDIDSDSKAAIFSLQQ